MERRRVCNRRLELRDAVLIFNVRVCAAVRMDVRTDSQNVGWFDVHPKRTQGSESGVGCGACIESTTKKLNVNCAPDAVQEGIERRVEHVRDRAGDGGVHHRLRHPPHHQIH